MSKFMEDVERAMILLAISQNPNIMRFMTTNEIHALLSGDKE
jgi:hypothetical protein